MLRFKLRRFCCVSRMKPPADKLLLPCLGAVKIRRALSGFIEAVLRNSVCHKYQAGSLSLAPLTWFFFFFLTLKGLSLCQISESLVSTTTKTHVHFFLPLAPGPEACRFLLPALVRSHLRPGRNASQGGRKRRHKCNPACFNLNA